MLVFVNLTVPHSNVLHATHCNLFQVTNIMFENSDNKYYAEHKQLYIHQRALFVHQACSARFEMARAPPSVLLLPVENTVREHMPHNQTSFICSIARLNLIVSNLT